jgi:hypothetical protein
MELESSPRISEKKKRKYNALWEFVGAELFHADWRTDMTELDSRFSQFCERSYNFLLLATHSLYQTTFGPRVPCRTKLY